MRKNETNRQIEPVPLPASKNGSFWRSFSTRD
jgi:hypothetical protein